MRITTWNVNGLRAALRKGFLERIEQIAPDVLLLQEVRATPDQLGPWAAPQGWFVHWHPALRPGYAGTAIWSREPIESIRTALDTQDADEEGRVLSAVIAGIAVHNIYLPSGSSSPERQIAKEAWMARFRPWADQQLSTSVPTLVAGDLNIAIGPRDIFHARSNEKQSGYLPHERAWMSELIVQGWDDLVREDYDRRLAEGRTLAPCYDTVGEGLDPALHGPYTWWSNRGGARARNRGWRIDYLLGTRPLRERVRSCRIDRQASLGVSDHAPVSVDLS